MRIVLAIAAFSLAAASLAEPAFAHQRLHTGATVQGELAEGDDQLQPGEFSDAYGVQGQAASRCR